MQEGMPDISLNDLKTIAQRFADSYIDARRRLHAYLQKLDKNDSNPIKNRQPHALTVAITQQVQSSAQSIKVSVDIPAENDKSCVGPITCPDPGCVAACTAAYNSACTFCAAMLYPAARAVFYSGAMASYAVCLRECG